MRFLKYFTALGLIIGLSAAALTETPEEMGTRLMKINNDRPVFEKVKTKGTLVIYNSAGVEKFRKQMLLGTYTENMGTSDFCEKYITYFMSPQDDQGNSYMMYHYKNQADIKWIYLKGIRKAKKVTGADKKLSFFGSDFTNSEASKPNYLDWNYKYLGDDKVEFKGKIFDCYKVESLPKDSSVRSDQGCGRRVSYFEKKTHLTLRLDIYDENMVKTKELRLLSFLTKNNIKGQKVYYETGLEMRNVKTGSKSHLLFSDLKVEEESNLRTDIFSEQYLTQKWW